MVRLWGFCLPFPLSLIFFPYKDQVNFSYDFRAKPSVEVHLFQVSTCC